MLTPVSTFVATGLSLPGWIGENDPEPSSQPSLTMHTLEDIYQKLETVGLVYPKAGVEKTGQVKCYNASGEINCAGTGQDGVHQKGITWPNPRFTDNSDGTVKDNLTGLIWLKNANCFVAKTWATASELMR